MDFSTTAPQRPAASRDDLRAAFVGRRVSEVPKPAAVMDLAVVRRNCAAVDAAVTALGVGFRAHIKTHKTVELTRMQVDGGGGSGDTSKQKPVKLIVSTLAEMELVAPLLSEYAAAGREVNILYGIPLPPSQVGRLARIAAGMIGAGVPGGSVSVLVDHPAQLEPLATTFRDVAGFPAKVFVKVDTGYHRAGLPPAALNKGGLLERMAELEAQGRVEFLGLYSHSSLSYNGSTPKDAMDALAGEIEGCVQALRECSTAFAAWGAGVDGGGGTKSGRELVISVGASPQIISVGNLLSSSPPTAAESDSTKLRAAIASVSSSSPGAVLPTRLELHAGVYAVRDIQQLATNAIPPSPGSPYGIDAPEQHVAFSVAAEVCSVYNDGERDQPEALVAVGVLGLGREPCKMYPGWGVLGTAGGEADGGRRMMIGRISQEHGIATWLTPAGGLDGEQKQDEAPRLPLSVGQVVRVYPNHACITGAMYPWYLVVDSDTAGDAAGEVIRDVYVRGSGW